MNQQVHWSSILLYIIAWIACSIFAVVILLSVREASLDVMTAIQASQMESSAEKEKIKTQLDIGFMIRATDQVLLFASGVVFVVLAIGIEVYFRRGMYMSTRELLKRVGLVVIVEAIIFVVSVIIRTVV